MPQQVQPPVVNRSGTVAIIGRTNVGKSTLLNAALKEKLAIVSAMPQTTRDRILGVVRAGCAQIALLDTPGLHKPVSRLGKRMNSIARQAVVGADAIIFVASVPKRPHDSYQPHPGDASLLADLGAGLPTVLAINKVDLWGDKSHLLPVIEAYAKLRQFAAIVPISARNDDGVSEVMSAVAGLLPERGPSYGPDFLTDRPMRFFASEFVRGEVIRATREEVPHSVAVVIDQFDDAGPVTHIHATIHCARDGHRGIIIGKQGLQLREIGTAARLQIEKLLEKHVCLKLWVRVTQNWTESASKLDEMGYGIELGSKENER